jgi:ACS family 4-hydroxyphenylacetate permease-like MFS transporter
MFAGAVGWAMAAGLTSPVWRLAGLVLANICTIAAWPVFFTLPSLVLPPKAHAAGIAYLNVIGIAGTSVTPLIMGIMKDWTGSFTASMLSMGGVFVIGALAMFLVPRRLIAHREDDTPVPATAAARS